MLCGGRCETAKVCFKFQCRAPTRARVGRDSTKIAADLSYYWSIICFVLGRYWWSGACSTIGTWKILGTRNSIIITREHTTGQCTGKEEKFMRGLYVKLGCPMSNCTEGGEGSQPHRSRTKHKSSKTVTHLFPTKKNWIEDQELLAWNDRSDQVKVA